MKRLAKIASHKTAAALLLGLTFTTATATSVRADAWIWDLDASDRWEKSQEHCADHINPAHRYKWMERKVLIKPEQHIVHTQAGVHGFEFDPLAVKPFQDPYKYRIRSGREPENRTHLIKPPKRRVTYIPPVYEVIREKVPITAVGTYCPPLSKFERWTAKVKRDVYRVKGALRGRREHVIESHRVYK